MGFEWSIRVCNESLKRSFGVKIDQLANSSKISSNPTLRISHRTTIITGYVTRFRGKIVQWIPTTNTGSDANQSAIFKIKKSKFTNSYCCPNSPRLFVQFPLVQFQLHQSLPESRVRECLKGNERGRLHSGCLQKSPIQYKWHEIQNMNAADQLVLQIDTKLHTNCLWSSSSDLFLRISGNTSNKRMESNGWERECARVERTYPHQFQIR